MIASVMEPAKAATLVFVLALAGCVTNPRTGRVPDWSSESTTAPTVPAPPLVTSSATNAITSVVPSPVRVGPAALDDFQETWVPLSLWTKKKGLEPPNRVVMNGLPAYSVKSQRGGFTVQPGNPAGNWDGIQVQLGFPPQIIGDQPCLHSLDVRKTLAPLLTLSAPAWQKTNSVIVLDPGHGGLDSGTRTASGRCEKEFTLDWARRLQQVLQANGWKAYLTRDTDVDLALTNRVAIADELHADLFLSLHFNATESGQAQSGLETYCLTPAGQPSNMTRGYGDMVQQAYPNNSCDAENILLATRVHRALLAGMHGLRDRGVRRARFLGVLRPQLRPAILLEAGYLSNPDEARQVADPEYRQQLAEAVARGLIGRADIAGLRVSPTQARAGGIDNSVGHLSPAR